MTICRQVQEECEAWAGVKPEVTDVMAAFQKGMKGRCETRYGLTSMFDVKRGVMQGCICSPARSLLQLKFMQAMVVESCHGYKFRDKGTPLVYYCDDAVYLVEDIQGLQMAFDAAWLAAKVAGGAIKIKPEESVTKRGTKTAWMGTYWTDEGEEKEITGLEIRMPNMSNEPKNEEKIPQVSQYTHLGVSIHALWNPVATTRNTSARARAAPARTTNRHQEARTRVKNKCTQLLRLIGKIDQLGPEQTKKCMDLVISGVMGYTARSTPMDWNTCQEIEAVRAEVMAKRDFTGKIKKCKAPIFNTTEGAGMGHIHAYQVAAASFIDQFDRALNAGKGEPAHEAVSEAIESRHALGVEQASAAADKATSELEFLIVTSQGSAANSAEMDEARAKQSKAKAVATKYAEANPYEWNPIELEDTLSEDLEIEAWLLFKIRAQIRGTRTSRPTHAHKTTVHPSEGTETKAEKGKKIPHTDIGNARRTAQCLGGWEYERISKKGTWIEKRHIPKSKAHIEAMTHAETHNEIAFSLRRKMEMDCLKRNRAGCNTDKHYIGRWAKAITGLATDSDTETRVDNLVDLHQAYTRDHRHNPEANAKDASRAEGFTGKHHTTDPNVTGVTYFRGDIEITELEEDEMNEEQLKQFEDGKTITQSVSYIGLALRRRWEQLLPAKVSATEDTIPNHLAKLDIDPTHASNLPPYLPHTYTNWREEEQAEARNGEGPWIEGGWTGHTQIYPEGSVTDRRDPVSRTMHRYGEWEDNSRSIRFNIGNSGYNMDKSNTWGHVVSCDKTTRLTMARKRTGKENIRAIRTMMTLHYLHNFTRCAFTDGSLYDPRKEGGKEKRKVAYGIWEGIAPEEVSNQPVGGTGWNSWTTAERVERCIAEGMWGGGLPADWEIADAEAYAIYKYLLKIVNTSSNPSQERVMILSDSQVTLSYMHVRVVTALVIAEVSSMGLFRWDFATASAHSLPAIPLCAGHQTITTLPS